MSTAIFLKATQICNE